MAKFLTTREAARRISECFFAVSHRTLETWPDLHGRIINRQRLHTVEEIDAAAERRIAAAEAKAAD